MMNPDPDPDDPTTRTTPALFASTMSAMDRAGTSINGGVVGMGVGLPSCPAAGVGDCDVSPSRDPATAVLATETAVASWSGVGVCVGTIVGVGVCVGGGEGVMVGVGGGV